MKRLRGIVIPALLSLTACQTTQSVSMTSNGKGDLFSALVQQESGGRNRIVSHAGAVGRAQLTLPTARLMARKLGMRGVAKLSNRQLRRRLMRDPQLNERLGRAYFNEGRRKYGRDDIALIYYNGGPKAANAAYRSWRKTGRLAIYTGETYCYLKSIARKSGLKTAPMTLIKGRAYRRNRSRWLRRTGRAPCSRRKRRGA
ncbi:hypothetical protein MnTg02_02020 [bacterium MnTg02]|nr:hypothetical protein MnTg02_02020 [bacterium MnTg02]